MNVDEWRRAYKARKDAVYFLVLTRPGITSRTLATIIMGEGRTRTSARSWVVLILRELVESGRITQHAQHGPVQSHRSMLPLLYFPVLD